MQNAAEKQVVETIEQLKLADIEAGQIETLKVEHLRKLCKVEGIKISGKKGELVKRLLLKKSGQSTSYTGQLTKCRICGSPVRVTGTNRKTLGDGRILVTRQIRCAGRHKHTYPLKEIVDGK